MSDTTTPRTDELAMNKSISQEDANELIWVLAKQLERELAEATAKVKELQGQVSVLRVCVTCNLDESFSPICYECKDYSNWTMKGAK